MTKLRAILAIIFSTFHTNPYVLAKQELPAA